MENKKISQINGIEYRTLYLNDNVEKNKKNFKTRKPPKQKFTVVEIQKLQKISII